MKVLVYVEGPSDAAALERLLTPVSETGSRNGVGIKFLYRGSKSAILKDVTRIAAAYLNQHEHDAVIAMPDLYPTSGFKDADAHTSSDELTQLLRRRFKKEADAAGLRSETRDRFLAHCQKYDLEALLLAAKDQLRARLGTTDKLDRRWRLPVEDQDDATPPKRVVEKLFAQYRKKGYDDVLDAPVILKGANLDEIVNACPQCFAPFVNDLRRLVVQTPPKPDSAPDSKPSDATARKRRRKRQRRSQGAASRPC